MDLDLHCLQEKPANQKPDQKSTLFTWFHTVFERVSKERYKLISCFGQVKFSLDKYIMAIYLSLYK